jgi:hypothetical protein
MKKFIFCLILVSALGSAAFATQANINCVTADGKFINITVLVDHGAALFAQMEVISPYLYADKQGNTSGAMKSVPTPRGGGKYWYSSNDNYSRYGYGMDIPNQLIFSAMSNYPTSLYFGPAGQVVSSFPVSCNSTLEN